MRNYVIVTDSAADLSIERAEQLGLRIVPLGVMVDGVERQAKSTDDVRAIYTMLREKKSATTNAANIEQFLEFFGEILKEDVDLLYLGFSSALSGTFSASSVALQELAEQYPDRKLYAVDTLCASMGQGLLVWYAAKMKENGSDIDTVKDFVENNKLNLCHWFTVDDLFFLKRGGRISAATAVVGSLLNIKPVMHVDNAGRLINVSKVRGRKAAIDAIFQKAKETMLEGRNDVMFISHGDCVEDAEYLAGRVQAELGVKQVVIDFIGPVIGAHSGPGTLALFFLGSER
ncbi:MAG: DegV family protein [Clostridia bacterium]|nr:DegV family protein [Clostridia bacterium]